MTATIFTANGSGLTKHVGLDKPKKRELCRAVCANCGFLSEYEIDLLANKKTFCPKCHSFALDKVDKNFKKEVVNNDKQPERK